MGAESLPLLDRRLIREARFQDRPGLEVPEPGLFDLPVRVFQIGLGGYIRGHADVFLHDAVAAGAYGGRGARVLRANFRIRRADDSLHPGGDHSQI